MRALHLVKTSDGGLWAARQCQHLGMLGVDVHVALPDLNGGAAQVWRDSGATLHLVDASVIPRSPMRTLRNLQALRRLVRRLRPDLVHAHFVSNALASRLALGPSTSPARVFQVPGPLHLEHRFFRNAEIASSMSGDYWIATSKAIAKRYERAGISGDRVYLSYCPWFSVGAPTDDAGPTLRTQFRISAERAIVGNINMMYAPRRHLGQRIGIKAHEVIIDAMAELSRVRSDFECVLVGGAFGGAHEYEKALRARAARVAPGRVHFTGRVPYERAAAMWSEFDLCVHVPTSENCGGVIEPLHAGVPVVASDVGGLPEVIVPGKTGQLVPPGDTRALANAVAGFLDAPGQAREEARRGRALVSEMFDVERSTSEIADIYRHILGRKRQPPARFDSVAWLSATP